MQILLLIEYCCVLFVWYVMIRRCSNILYNVLIINWYNLIIYHVKQYSFATNDICVWALCEKGSITLFNLYISNVSFSGESITLTPTPAYVLHGHVLELTCKSNRTKGFYEFFYMKSEQKISLGRGGGSFQSCLNETDTGTTIDCDFGNNSWKFTLLISNPEHNQTIFCKDDRNTSVNSTIFLAGISKCVHC